MGMAAVLALAPSASADTYKPTRTGDPSPNRCRRHNCSLREAVRKANHHPGADKIVLHGGSAYDLRIENAGGLDEDQATTGDLDLLRDVTITHSGRRRATIKAHGVDRVFHFPGTDLRTPTGKLSGLVIRGGHSHATGPVVASKSGAGIDVDSGHLVVKGSIIAGNEADGCGGGIDADLNTDTTVRISRSKIVDNSSICGGGVWSSAPTSIRKSTLSGNSSGGDGGGLTSYDKLNIVNSTISRNTAGGFDGFGGGVFLGGHTATFTNDTITKNTAHGNGGGIYNGDSGVGTEAATTNLNAVTIARNTATAGLTARGGGIYQYRGVVNVRNSLIGLNHAGGSGGPDCDRTGVDGDVISHGHNVIGDSTNCIDVWVGNDITDEAPRIGKLAANGGPTRTIALQRHSPAIAHAGKATAPGRDQRGYRRDEKPDTGAFERGAGP